jgi:glycosyltransferase involved in cell wall biosynthesis
MHILLVTTGYPPDHSGAGGRLHQLYCRLAKQDATFSWSVLTKSRSRSAAQIAGPSHISIFVRGESEFPSKWEAVQEIAWAVKQLRSGLLDGVDLLHVAGWSWAVIPLIWGARRRGIPIIRELTTPGEPGGNHPGGRLIRWSNRQAAEIVAISPALAAEARLNTPGIPIWCRPNGVDTARFRLADSVTRLKLRSDLRHVLPDLEADDHLILHVGRIRPLKNQLLLANSVARLPPNFKLLLAGPAYYADDRYADMVRRRLAQPDLVVRAALMQGNIANIDLLMQAADIFAFPSTQEGLGTVMIEALCCGLVVVASRIPGVTDWIIKDGKNGFLSSLDEAQLAEHLASATNLLPSRIEIAAAAAKIYDQTLMDKGYLDLIRRHARIAKS